MKATFDFSDRVILVTGGTQGIGLGIARAFANAGACVHITGTRDAAADYDDDLSGFAYHQAQLARPEARAALVAALPELDVLINNAGMARSDEYTLAGYAKVMEVNLAAAVDLCFRYHDALKASRGAIVNVASSASHISLREMPAYTASKSGLFGFTRAVADKWARDGIRVNQVAPGFIDTRIIDHVRSDSRRHGNAIRSIPMRRYGTPDEVASAVLFLASDAAAYIAGHSLVIDGGLLLR